MTDAQAFEEAFEAAEAARQQDLQPTAVEWRAREIRRKFSFGQGTPLFGAAMCLAAAIAEKNGPEYLDILEKELAN